MKNTEVILTENKPNGAKWKGVVKPFMLKSIEENQYSGGFKRYSIDIYDEVEREPSKQEIKEVNEFFDKVGGRYAKGSMIESEYDWEKIYQPLSKEEQSILDLRIKKEESELTTKQKDDWAKQIRAKGDNWNKAFLLRVNSAKLNIDKFVEWTNKGEFEKAQSYFSYAIEDLDSIRELRYEALKYGNNLEKKLRNAYDIGFIQRKKISKFAKGSTVKGGGYDIVGGARTVYELSVPELETQLHITKPSETERIKLIKKLIEEKSDKYAKGSTIDGLKVGDNVSTPKFNNGKILKIHTFNEDEDIQGKLLKKGQGLFVVQNLDINTKSDLYWFFSTELTKKMAKGKTAEVERGWWSIVIEEDENDEESRNEEVARLIRGGFTSGYYPTWTLKTTIDIGDNDEHIASLVEQGYKEGELINEAYAKVSGKYAKGSTVKGNYFSELEANFSSTRRGGVKNYSVDIDLENGEQLRGGDLDFKDGNDALFLYERVKQKGEYRHEKIEDIQLIVNFKNGDYETVDIPKHAHYFSKLVVHNPKHAKGSTVEGGFGKEVYWYVPFHAYEKNGIITIYANTEKIGSAKDLKDAKFQIDNLQEGYGMGSDYLKNSEIEWNNGYYYLKVGSSLQRLSKNKNIAEMKYKFFKKGAEYTNKFAKGSTVKGKRKTAEEIYEEEQHNAMFNSEFRNGGGVGKKYYGWVDISVENPQMTMPYYEDRVYAKGRTKAELKEDVIKKLIEKGDSPKFVKTFTINITGKKYSNGGGVYGEWSKEDLDEEFRYTNNRINNLSERVRIAEDEIKEGLQESIYNKYANGGGVGSDETPKVWVGEWSLYNEGKLIGEWVDLSDYSSGEEVMDKIQELLDKWTEETGENREEYGVFDFENFPRSMYSEQMGEQEFDNVIKAWEFSQDRDVPMEVIGNIVSEYEPSDLEEWFDEHYEGQFDSDRDLAYHYVDVLGGIEQLGKDTTERYFDYESFGRDLAYDYNNYDGHYFRSYKRGGNINKFDLKNYLTKGGFNYTIGGL